MRVYTRLLMQRFGTSHEIFQGADALFTDKVNDKNVTFIEGSS